MDVFLIATVLLIFAVGVYDLFVGQIDEIEDAGPGNVLKITSQEQLKDKLGKVIVMILVVRFFKSAMTMEYDTPIDLVLLSSGIVLTSFALTLVSWKKKASGSNVKENLPDEAEPAEAIEKTKDTCHA